MIQVTNIIVVTTAHSILRDTTDNFNFNFNVFVTHLCTNKTYSATSQKFKAPAEDTVQSAPFPFEPHKTLKFKYVWRSVIRIDSKSSSDLPLILVSFYPLKFKLLDRARSELDWTNRMSLYLNSRKQFAQNNFKTPRTQYDSLHPRMPIIWNFVRQIHPVRQSPRFSIISWGLPHTHFKIPIGTYTYTPIDLWIIFFGVVAYPNQKIKISKVQFKSTENRTRLPSRIWGTRYYGRSISF